MKTKTLFIILLSWVLNGEEVAGVTGAGGVEIQVVPATNLLTGIYYSIGLPAPGFSVLTWADVSAEGDPSIKFIQMDDHANRSSRYAKDGDWYQRGLWFLEASTKTGFFSIHGADPKMVISMSPVEIKPDTEAPADYYLTYGKDSGKDYSLWQVIAADDGQTYQLMNYGLPGLAATTTRFGTFYRWVGAESLSNDTDMGRTLFKFKLEAVNIPYK